MQNRTRIITEGASTVLIALFLLGVSFIPIIAVIGFFLLPVPLMVFTSKHGLKAGLLCFFCVLLIAVFFFQVISAGLAFGFLLIGVVMGVALHRKGTVWHLLIGGSISNIVVLLTAYGISSLIFHFNPVTWMTGYMQNTLTISLKMSSLFQKSGVNTKVLQDAIQNMSQVAPALIVTVAVFYAFIIEHISGFVLKRLRVPFPKWPPFREWRFPRQLMWYYVLALIVGTLWGGSLGKGWTTVDLNLLYLLEWVIVIQGLSFIYYFFHQKKQRVIFPVLITLFSLLVPVILYIVRILGIIDLGFDFRSRVAKK